MTRTVWDDNFADAVILAPLSVEKNNPDYDAGKAGNLDAALRFVESILTVERFERIEKIASNAEVIVSIHAEEAQGTNRIPVAFAAIIGKSLDIAIDVNIVQSDRPLRSAGDGFYRLANQPSFNGEVQTGKAHLLVDDTITQGGTLATLKGYIEQNGGRVVGIAALTGKQYSAKIALSNKALSTLREKHSDLEQWWHTLFGYGFDGLTESEARYLINADDADTIRNRVLAARQEAIRRISPSEG